MGEYPIYISKYNVRNQNDRYVNGTLTITKAPLTVTARSYTRLKDTQNPDEWELRYDGFRLADYVEVLDEVPMAYCEATEDSAPGTYPIMVMGGRAENYELIGIPGTLTILDPQGIDELTTDYGDGTFYVYDAHDRLLRRHATSLHGLGRGLFITKPVNGGPARKVVVK